ncbi:hypothetical protein IJ798_00580 [Candidatus Saccharibacteria bacterium]|nr:hypothetical protein [Candidatus Saccharibacteria bacterium]
MEPQGNEKISENVNYDQNVVNSHIDMNPPQVIEPTTGSSVIVEPKNEVPNNGFPIGYGPNEHLKKIEKPKKPKLHERLKHARKKLSLKAKILIITIPLGLALLIGGFIVYANLTGMFKTDYSGTYLAAKELRTEMQKLRSDSNCDRVSEYVDNQYASKDTYSKYIEGCKTAGEGVDMNIVNKISDTAGVLRDEEIRKRYDILVIAIKTAKEGNSDVDKILKIYTTWHSWILAESDGNISHNDWDWTEGDLTNASNILIESGVTEFKDYGEKWLQLKQEAAVATNLYYHHDPTQTNLSELYTDMTTKQNAFNEWKKENEPDVSELFPLELVDMAKLYSKFEDFYDYLRETYQNNYNYQVGGCKEFVNSIVCD